MSPTGSRAPRASGAHSINARTPLPLTLDVDEPLAVGADRIVNILGALDRYPGDSIVVDFGTATTFDCVTADRRFIGGSIMPGLRTSADQLVRKAAKLTATELRPPARAIGRTTEEHIQGGVLFGAADSVDGMIRRLRAEWPETAGNGKREEGTGRAARDCYGGPVRSGGAALHLSRRGGWRPDTARPQAGRAPRRSSLVNAGGGSARALGYRLLGSRLDYLLHLRPAEWPIMAGHTLLGSLLALGIGARGLG